MTKFKLLGATALVVALASPVMAQDVPRDQTHKQMRMTPRTHQRHMAYRQDRMARNMTRDNTAYRNDNNGRNNNGWNDAWNDNRWDRRDSGFWPGDVAAGVVGGAVATADAAVNTAGVIATAPFHGDSYAYYNDPHYTNGYNNDYNAADHDTYVKNLRDSGYNPAGDRDANGIVKQNY